MILPQVFAAGFPRCGTTWIARTLNQHPEIHIPLKEHPKYPYLVKKELHYFNKTPYNLNDKESENPDFNKNITEYISYFNPEKINIDFSICAAYDLESAKRVKEVLGDVKILFFVRNKEEHAESLKILNGKETDKHFLDLEKPIESYKKVFSKIKIINLDLIKCEPIIILMLILKFIGVKDTEFKFDLTGSKHSSKEIKKYNTP